MLEVIKRNGKIAPFNKRKIEEAILKAMRYGSGIVEVDIAKIISEKAEKDLYTDETKLIDIYTIEEYVFNSLIKYNQNNTARAYEGYRAVREEKRIKNTTDNSIISLINLENKETMEENSNKSAVLLSTQRDLIAGEVSKDIARRKIIPPHIIQAHNNGVLHWHK